MRAALVISLVAALAAPAFANDKHAAAAHFQKGSQLYADGQWADALAEFQAGYDAYPLRGFLVNIGQCYRKLERLDEAADAWRRFLDSHPADARLRGEVEDALAEVESERAKRAPDTAPAAPSEPAPAVAVEPPPPAALPLTPPAPPSPSMAETSPALVAAAPPPQTKKRRKWVWAVIGVAAASVAAAAVGVGVYEWQLSTPRSGSLGLIDGRR
jgi:hypothetical protein